MLSMLTAATTGTTNYVLELCNWPTSLNYSK